MPIIVDYSGASVFSSAALTVGIPANTSAQALFLCVSECVLGGTTPSINTPSGWTLLATGVSSGPFINSARFYKPGDGSLSQVITLSAAALWIEAAGLVVDDVDLSSIIDASNKRSVSGGLIHGASAAALTTTQANDLIIAVWGIQSVGPAVISSPAGMATVAQLSTDWM